MKKHIDTHIVTHTNGKGLWSSEEREVHVNKLKIGFNSLEVFPNEDFYGELRAYFEDHGFTVGSWNVEGHGLIYTDKLWLREFKKGLRELGLSRRAVQDVDYSEQGMQGHDYVSLDVGKTFWASWKRLLIKKNLESTNAALSATNSAV